MATEGIAMLFPPLMLKVLGAEKARVGEDDTVKFGYAPLTFTLVLCVITGTGTSMLYEFAPSVVVRAAPVETTEAAGTATALPPLILMLPPAEVSDGVAAIVKF